MLCRARGLVSGQATQFLGERFPGAAICRGASRDDGGNEVHQDLALPCAGLRVEVSQEKAESEVYPVFPSYQSKTRPC